MRWLLLLSVCLALAVLLLTSSSRATCSAPSEVQQPQEAHEQPANQRAPSESKATEASQEQAEEASGQPATGGQKVVKIARRRPRVYRIRAAQAANGKLGPPVRVVEVTSVRQAEHQADRPQRLQLQQFGARTSPPSSAHSGKLAAAAKSEPCQQQQVPAGSEATNVAATSQTLRLFGAANLRPLGSVGAQQQEQRVPAAGGQETIGATSAREVDESQQRQQAATRDTRNRQQQADRLGAASHRLQLLPGSLDDQAPESSSAANSILSLIDDFDSKITTNRTKGELRPLISFYLKNSLSLLK